jgi:hypothetical protein
LNERQALRELSPQRDAIPLNLATGQGDNLDNGLVNVDGIVPRGDLLDERAYAADDLAGLIACLDDTIKCVPDL